jgi:hypothetical protein
VIVTASLTPQLIESQPQRDSSDCQGESSDTDSEPSHEQMASLVQSSGLRDPRPLPREESME